MPTNESLAAEFRKCSKSRERFHQKRLIFSLLKNVAESLQFVLANSVNKKQAVIHNSVLLRKCELGPHSLAQTRGVLNESSSLE